MDHYPTFQTYPFLDIPTSSLGDSALTSFPSLETDPAILRARLCHYDIFQCPVCYQKLVELAEALAPLSQAHTTSEPSAAEQSTSNVVTTTGSLAAFDHPERLHGHAVPWDIMDSDIYTGLFNHTRQAQLIKEQEPEDGKFWRQRLLHVLYDAETQQAWVEAKAVFDIPAKEEPGDCAAADHDVPIPDSFSASVPPVPSRHDFLRRIKGQRKVKVPLTLTPGQHSASGSASSASATTRPPLQPLTSASSVSSARPPTRPFFAAQALPAHGPSPISSFGTNKLPAQVYARQAFASTSGALPYFQPFPQRQRGNTIYSPPGAFCQYQPTV